MIGLRELKGSALSLLMLLGLATTSASPAGATTDTAGADGDPFVIGAVIPLTGAFGAVGQQVQDGLEVARDQLNEAGGILGHPIEVVVKDDASDTSRSPLALQELLEQDEPDVVIANAISAGSLAMLPITTEREILTITASGAPELADVEQFPFNFQLSVPFDLQATPMACAVVQLGASRPGIIVTDDAGGAANGDNMDRVFPDYGLEVAGYESFATDAADITAQLQTLRDAGADAIVTQAAGETIGTVMRGIRDLGWDVDVIATNGSVTGDINALIPDEVQDQFVAAVFRILVRNRPDAVDEPYQDFVDRLVELGEITNLQVPALHRDIVFLIEWAAETAGSTEADVLKEALESTSEAEIEPGTLLIWSNPEFGPEMHTTTNADYSGFYALAEPSERLFGTYLGEPLEDC